ncbi:MAG: nuclear transport factor 2 family protein [Sphingomonadaceae bacterium]|nr:nuclear transport factor 2 family protein [Sphingomonadaceae bacterium]
MSGAHTGLARWHEVMEGGNAPAALAAIITEDAVFHSPVVHTPQHGRALVVAYLAAAGQVFADGQFTYQREIVDGNDAMLEFTAELDGIYINGIDLITFDDDGFIKDFKVMVRPLKALNKLWEMMAAQLERAKSQS